MAESKPPPIEIRRKGYRYVRLPKSKLAGAKGRILIDQDIQFGEPCVEGTRVPAYIIAGRFKAGETTEELVDDFPGITAEDIEAAVDYVEGK